MAVKFFMTQASVETGISNVENNIDVLKDKYDFSYAQKHINDQLQELEINEGKVLSLLGLKGKTNKEKLDDLQKKILKCENAHAKLKNITGKNLLKNIIIPIKAKLEYQKDENQKQFTDAIVAYLGEGKAFRSEKSLQEEIFKILNSEEVKVAYANAFLGDGKKAKEVYAPRGLNTKKPGDIILSKLTDVQQKRAKQFVILFNEGKISPLSNTYKAKEKTSVNGEDIETKVDLYTITQNPATGFPYKQSEAKNLSAEQDKKIRDDVKATIISYVGDDPDFKKAVDYVIDAQRANIYFGQNIENEFVGLIGEIQAYYYLSVLLNRNNPNKAELEWIGGVIGANGKPHEDLILSEGARMYGIQVKNTTKDIFSKDIQDQVMEDIGFAEASPDTFFNYTNLSPEERDIVEQAYALEAFNIEYSLERDNNGNYVRGSNPTFQDDRELIESLKRDMDVILSMFAANLMYMATGDAVNKIGSVGNTLYILAGNNVKLASQVLLEIFKKIEQQESGIKIRGYYNGELRTIVDYFNNEKKARKDRKDVSAIGKLILSSSYNFTL